MVRCQACGTENPEGAQYCVNCARKLDAATQEAVVRQRESHTATGIAWSRVLIAVLVILVIALVLTLVLTHVI